MVDASRWALPTLCEIPNPATQIRVLPLGTAGRSGIGTELPMVIILLSFAFLIIRSVFSDGVEEKKGCPTLFGPWPVDKALLLLGLQFDSRCHEFHCMPSSALRALGEIPWEFIPESTENAEGRLTLEQ